VVEEVDFILLLLEETHHIYPVVLQVFLVELNIKSPSHIVFVSLSRECIYRTSLIILQIRVSRFLLDENVLHLWELAKCG